MLPEQKEQLEKLKRARVKEDIPKDLAIAIQAFLKQAAIVWEYELDSMPSEYMENLLKTFARYPEYCETMYEMYDILKDADLIE